MWGLLISFLLGLLVGWMSPGREDKSRLFWRAPLWGALIALVLVAIGVLFGVDPLGVLSAGYIAWMIGFVVLLVVFVIGVWIGDMIEGRRHSGPGARRV